MRGSLSALCCLKVETRAPILISHLATRLGTNRVPTADGGDSGAGHPSHLSQLPFAIVQSIHMSVLLLSLPNAMLSTWLSPQGAA